MSNLLVYMLPNTAIMQALETAWTRLQTNPHQFVATALVGAVSESDLQAKVYIKIIRFDAELLAAQPESGGLCAQL